nr:hypothetical protein GCM10020092_067700 [Actinoplanes digitatis]
MTNSVPYCADRVSTATDIGSVPSESVESLRLMLTMSAPDVAAHCMPSSTHESWPEPLLLRTLPTMRSAPGATPLYEPPEAAPVPTIVEATCVPWPLTSAVSSPGTKLTFSSI